METMKATGTEGRVCKDIADRQIKGLRKYGVSIEGNDLPLRDWLVHQYEELLDAAIYCRRAIEEMDDAEYKRLACPACKLLYCECDEYE